MTEEPSSEFTSLPETEAVAQPSRATTLISLVILSVIVIGLVAWWFWPKRAEPAAVTEAKEERRIPTTTRRAFRRSLETRGR